MSKWIFGLAGLAMWADTYPRQPGVDVEHYAFRIALSDATDEIRGEARVDFRTRGAELSLDLAMAMMVDGVAAGLTPLAYEHRGDRLRITLPASAAQRSVTVRYHGKPASGFRIGPNLHGERTFFSLNWPDLARQ